ncbi:MAG: hypothetical protein COA97_05500 [Flavobacteriales bacterium]|nr:MAG: hypothetical protein COA97_05500 [Flavobacteriales bacterium]
MTRLFTYCCLLIICCFSYSLKAQYLCDNEHKVINKQRKKLKKKCKKIASSWIINKRDSLNLPEKLKISKLKFRANSKEIDKVQRYNKWREIDSLLCFQAKPSSDYVKKAKDRLLELQLVVYDIRTEFNFINTTNHEIKSVLNFEFDYNGNLIRAVIRKKKMSPFSETPH